MNDLQWEQFRHRRARLTKLWFALVALAILLQLEFAEQSFRGLQGSPSKLQVVRWDCSVPRLIQHSSDDKHSLVAPFVSFAGVSSVSSASKGLSPSFIDSLFGDRRVIYKPLAQEVVTSQAGPDCYSGLSPPILGLLV